MSLQSIDKFHSVKLDTTKTFEGIKALIFSVLFSALSAYKFKF